MKKEASSKPHVVCIPYPAQGHITPMLKLAKLFNRWAGFHVSFVNTHHNHQRLLKSGALPTVSSATSNSCSDSPFFRFFSIPDGLPPPKNPDATQDIPTMSSLIISTIRQPFKDLLVSKLLPCNCDNQQEEKNQNVPPPVSLILSDVPMTFTLDISREFGIPVALFWTTSACALLGYAQYQRLVDSSIIPLQDSSYLTNGFLDKVVDGIPSMEGIRLRDLPSFIRTTDRDNLMLNTLIRRVDTIARSSAPLIIQTFEALEHETIKTLSSKVLPDSPIFSIGPLELILNSLNIDKNQKEPFKSNLWKEDTQCISWLDSKPLNSVIYVNFGSVTVLPSIKVEEIAWGLANSENDFLWILRPDLVTDRQGQESILSDEFKVKVGGRGCIQSWCDQERVLKHPSIAGFLTHCGWNSTIESLSCGVPMICWPFFADQMTNCWFCCEKWGVGVGFSEDEVKREEVETLVREVVDGDRGRSLRERAMEWKRLAVEAATCPGGSSMVNFNNFINQVLH